MSLNSWNTNACLEGKTLLEDFFKYDRGTLLLNSFQFPRNPSQMLKKKHKAEFGKK